MRIMLISPIAKIAKNAETVEINHVLKVSVLGYLNAFSITREVAAISINITINKATDALLV